MARIGPNADRTGRGSRTRAQTDSTVVVLIRTKLHPPRVAPGAVLRPRLEERLDAGSDLPLTLVSAPAGYGKSTLVASWLSRSPRPLAWLTVDESDNDLASFLSYVVAAVRSVVPEGCPRTNESLQHSSLPSIPGLAVQLANDLDELEGGLVLALDDFHLISDLRIHDLVTALLRHPPAPVHLLLVGRYDPPLPLESLRARGWMEEIREADLRFSNDEAAQFFNSASESRLSENDVSEICRLTEGWIAGMKLAFLLLRRSDDANRVLQELQRGVEHIRQYLLAEILSAQPTAVQSRLIEASILERLSEPLWRAVASPTQEDEDATTEASWRSRAVNDGLFVIALDAHDEWFRFHHLFRDALLTELRRRLDQGQIAALHRRAATWLEHRGYDGEALHHYELAGDGLGAAALVKSVRTDLMAREKWSRLARWLRQLPDELVRQDPELLLTRAWIEEDSYQYVELLTTLNQIDALIAEQPTDPAVGRLRGEIDALGCARLFLTCQGAALVEMSRQAVAALPTHHLTARAFALALLTLGHQMCGDIDAAEAIISEAVRDRQFDGTTFEGTLLVASSMASWMEGDILRLVRTAGTLLRKAESTNLAKSGGYARYGLGVGLYETGELGDAERCLEPLLESRLDTELGNSVYGMFALSLIAQTTGRADRARELASRAVERALRHGNTDLRSTAEAFEAELALRQGRTAEAVLWARGFKPSILRLRNRFYQPEITLARALLEDTDGSRERLEGLLTELREHLEAIHARRHLVDVLALTALYENRRGNGKAALSTLTEAFDHAYPRGVRRPFHDLGPEMLDLLGQLDLDDAARDFVDSIPRFGGQPSEPDDMPPGPSAARNTVQATKELVEEFTDRELQVLTLLAQRYSNQEIAEDLGISPATVKRHNANIFDKFHVEGGRREAVAKALALGMLA